jgi:RIO kinase 1
MNDPLAPLVADGVVEEICARLKSGKEADLWLVRHGGELVAAKVYRAREARSFRNDASYREGRQVRDSRTQRAMDRGSRFGRAAAEEAWKTKEADALHTLHAAGVRVPRPVMFYEGVLLMELVVDARGHPAPRLVDAPVPREQAAALYADLRSQAVRMLGCDLVHGDLSPYNVLVAWNGPVVIDFPQVVGAAHNGQAEAFFRRDLENLRRHFAAIDPALRSAEGDAREIWRAYVRRELTPDFVPTATATARRAHAQPPRPPAQAQRPTQAARSRPPGQPASAQHPRRAEHHRQGVARGEGRRPHGGRGPGARHAARAPEVVVVRPLQGPHPAAAGDGEVARARGAPDGPRAPSAAAGGAARPHGANRRRRRGDR